MKPCTKLIIWWTVGIWMNIGAFAQSHWPKEIPLESGGKIILYQLQPETIIENLLTARAALSIRKQANAEPIFGAIWMTATVDTDKDERMVTLENIQIKEAKFPGTEDQIQATELLAILQKEIPKWQLDVRLDELVATMDRAQEEEKDSFNNDPPEIIYTQQPSMLVLIDGDPISKFDDYLESNRIENTPFLIVQNPGDRFYYLYAGHLWYRSSSITTSWTPISKLPLWIKSLDKQIKKQEKQEGSDQAIKFPAIPPAVIVRTNPAELIQTVGEAQFSPIEGTGLLYVTNTEDNIFMAINSQQYYVVLSGRWYKSATLIGSWAYVPPDSLPKDFANIPEGSAKDEVLAYVPGTKAAHEAVMDALIPQTAKIDRKKATCHVSYDGEPRFEPIVGTALYVAINASQTVLRANNQYYCVENGVWFVSNNATGPWSVSTRRPSDVDKIPPNSHAYPVKYVYIYDIAPDFVYMGYTAGYVGCYIYGPTIVYGTGYYYRPWSDRVYFPRPFTWGFGMYYNPWWGWNIGFGFGWFDYLFGPRPYYSGWWGPPLYRPHYRPSYRRERSYYGDHDSPDRPRRSAPRSPRSSPIVNLYQFRNDVVTRDSDRHESRRAIRVTAPKNQEQTKTTTSSPRDSRQPQESTPSTRQTQRPDRAKDVPNNVYTDQSGNTYQRNGDGNWQRWDGREWKSANRENNPSIPGVQRDHTLRERANNRVENFENQQPRTGRSPKIPSESKPSQTIRSPRAKSPVQ